MLDQSRMWFTVEGESDKKLEEQVKHKTLDSYPYKTVEISYRRLKKYMRLDKLQIGRMEGKDNYEIAGTLSIDGNTFKVCGFKPEVSISMYYFKRFMERLIKDIKDARERRFAWVKIMYYSKDLPIWVKIGDHIGAIMPIAEDEDEVEVANE